jgi:hypothetical protein
MKGVMKIREKRWLLAEGPDNDKMKKERRD